MKNCENNIINLCSHKKGDTFDGFTFEMQDDNNQPIDFNDVQDILIQFKLNKTSNYVPFEYKLSDNTIQIVDNKAQLMPRILNNEIGNYSFDCQLTYANGKIKTIFEGQMQITQDISR